MIKIAVIGTGLMGKEMIGVLSGMEETRVEIICGTGRSAEQVASLQKEYQVPYAFTDYKEMLNTMDEHPVDVIYLAVPNQLHYEMAKEAIGHHVNVFLEKPFTPTKAEAEELIELSRKQGVVLMEAISNQYLPVFAEIEKHLPEIGTITYADFNYCQYSSRYDRFLAGEKFAVLSPESCGGALMDLNVYNIHLAVGLLGLPKAITYHADTLRGVDVNGVAVLDYDGFRCTCVAAKDSQGPSRLLIQGTRGYLLLEGPANSLYAPLKLYLHRDKSLTEIYPPAEGHRMIYEFRALDRIISTSDWVTVIKSQIQTIAVAGLLENARSQIPYGQEIKILAELQKRFWSEK